MQDKSCWEHNVCILNGAASASYPNIIL